MIGTSGSDTFVGATTTDDSGDIIIDSSSADNDVFNYTVTDSTVALKVAGVENINVTTQVAGSGPNTVDATNFSGAKVLTVTGSNLTVGGATISGNKDVTVTHLNASNVAKVVAGSEGSVSVTQETKTGAVIDAAAVTTGTVAVVGSTTLTADNTTGAVSVSALASATTENKKAVVINAAKASSVFVDDSGADGSASSAGDNFTGAVTVNAAAATSVTVDNETSATQGGAVTVNAAKATTVTINNAAYGATVNAATANATSATINVSAIDDTGATINVGTGTATNALTINLVGTSATTDVATISGAGVITIDVDGSGADDVDTLNLSGTTAAVTYTVAGEFAKLAASGSQDVNVKTTGTLLDGTTVTGVKTLTVTAADGGTTSDWSKVSAGTIAVTADLAGDAITLANGANVSLAADQTATSNIGLKFKSATEGDAITVSTGDDNGDSTATPDITIATEANFAEVGTGKGTVTIDATTGKFTSSGATKATSTIDLIVKGTKDVALGTVTAKSLDASASSGKITLTSTTTVKTITTGSGIDTVTLNGSIAHVVTTNDGNDIVDIQSTAATAQVSTGAGNDTIYVADADAIVVSAGAGDDTVYVGKVAAGTASIVDTDAILVGGDGTDTLAILSADSGVDGNDPIDLSDNTNFAISGFEVVDITDANTTITISAAQFAQNAAFALKGTSDDTLEIKTKSTSTKAVSLDLSSLTLSSGSAAKVLVTTDAGADTVTGSANAETITSSAGADYYDGAAGTDTLTFAGTLPTESGSAQAAGYVINLGSTAINGTTVYATTGKYVAQSLTSIASGTAAYNFASDAATNSAVVKTIANIENITGSSGNDYIVGTAGDNVITGGAGADYITGGAGADTFVMASGAADVISDFATGSDKLSVNGILGTAVVTAGLISTASSTKYGSGATVSIAKGEIVSVANGGTAYAAADIAALFTGTAAASLWKSSYASDLKFIVAEDRGDDVALWLVADTATAGVTAGEVSLVGTLKGGLSVAIGDFI